MDSQQLSARQARRIALGAQGFTDRQPAGTPDRRSIRRVLRRVGLLQMDSVNVLMRAHFLPAFSRLGPYPVSTVEQMAYRQPRELFEYWGHEASLIPVHRQPLFRWRMAEASRHAWGRVVAAGERDPGLVQRITDLIATDGPLTSAQVGRALGEFRPTKPGSWWERDDAKWALEWLFYCGVISTADRPGFQRSYDLTERVLPGEVLATPTPEPAQAHRELALLAAEHLGVAAAPELRDYYRQPAAEFAAALAEVIEDGKLLPVRVQGWSRPGYVRPGVVVPRRMPTARLLSPFDPLVWHRERAARLFGFHYRIEIYTPAHKRVHGYYVLPMLLGDELVARFDLKADRATGTLLVRSAHAEQGCCTPTIAEAADTALRDLAHWLGLENVSVQGAGELAPLLRDRGIQGEERGTAPRRLAHLGGSEPDLTPARRRRPEAQ